MIICLSPGICIKLIGSLNCGHSHCGLLMVFHVDHIVFRERWFWFFPNLQAFLVMLAQCPLFGEYEPFYDGPSVHLTQLRLGPYALWYNLFQPHFIHSLPKLHTSTFLQKLLIYVEGGIEETTVWEWRTGPDLPSLVSHRTMTIAKPYDTLLCINIFPVSAPPKLLKCNCCVGHKFHPGD